MQRPRRTAQFTFHFLSISPTSIDQKNFLPANIELRRRHLKGRATIRISFNSNDFSLSIQATRAVVGEFSMSSRRHISMSCRDYACWRNNFQIMQIPGVRSEPQFIRSIVVHPSIVGKWLNLSHCFEANIKNSQP